MSQYRKKPVIIEARRVPIGEDHPHIVDFVNECVALAEWCDGVSHMMDPHPDTLPGIHIETLEGTMVASPGDWIIKGVQGEFYPCKPDIFAATYDQVESA